MKSIISIAAISAALIITPTSGSAQQNLAVASWGGAYTAALTESMYRPFETKNNIKIISADRGAGLGEIAAQVRSGNIKWDVVDTGPWEAIKACEEGLFEQIDPAKLPAGANGTPANKDFATDTILPCAVGVIFYSNVIAYDQAKYGVNGPKTVEDFFNITKFPGKRAVRKNAMVILEWALMADGVAVSDVYKVLATPAGMARAFKKLDTIKSSIVWWTAGSQPVQLLASGDVVMTQAWHGRIADANVKEKKNFAIVWDGQLKELTMWAILKGSKNSVAAQEFIRQSTSAQSMALLTNYIPYAPARHSSMALIPNDHPNKPWLPTSPHTGRSMSIDSKFWAENGEDIDKKFQIWLAK